MFRKNKEFYQAHINNGILCFDSRDYANAILAFTKAIDIDPQNLAYFHRAKAHEELRNYSFAAADYEEAERLGFKPICIYYYRGLMYIEQLNQTAKALRDAISLFKMGAKNDCAVIVRQCLPKIKPGDVDEIEKKDLFDSITTLEEWDLEMAISYLEPCLVKDDNNPLSARFWTRDSVLHGAPSTEKGTLKNICDYVRDKKLKLANESAKPDIELGLQQLQAGENEVAIAAFDFVIQNNPDCALAFYHRGEAHHRLGKHEEAIQDFCHAEKLGIEIKTYKRSLSYAHSSKIREALEDAIYVRKNGTQENGSAIAALCFSQITLDALKKIPRRELFNFIQSLPCEDQLHYLGIILRRGPLTVLGERFWKPQAFKLTSILEDELLIEMYEYLKGLDSEITLPENLEIMDELLKIPDSLQQLRFLICWQGCNESRQELSNYYSELLSQYSQNSDKRDAFQSADLDRYIEDFLYLGISEAEQLIRLALPKILRNCKSLTLIECQSSRYEQWIEFATSSIFPSRCIITRPMDLKNYQTYKAIWVECLDIERKNRCISNHNYKNNNPIEMLRFQIAYKKIYEKDCTAEKEELSKYYLEPEKYNFDYDLKLFERYKQDFYLLDISAAKEFVQRAIKDEIKKIKQLYDSLIDRHISYIGLTVDLPASNFLSKGCTIYGLLENKKNVQTYRELYAEALANEKKFRNVSNRKFKPKDEIEQLRLTLCIKKNDGEDFTTERDALAARYEIPAELGGFEYSVGNANRYQEDFLYLEISSAEKFVRLAIEEGGINRINLVTPFSPQPHRHIYFSDGFLGEGCRIWVGRHKENYEIFYKMLSEFHYKTGLYNKDVALEYHYSGDPEDPERIIYDPKDADKYVQDYLYGITTAESHILRAARENFSQVITILETHINSHPISYEKLLEIICEDQVEIENIQLLLSLKFKNQLKTHHSLGHADILEKAYSMKVLPTLLNDVYQNQQSSLSLDMQHILQTSKHPVVLNLVAIHFSHSNKREVAWILFKGSIYNIYMDRKNCLSALQNLKVYWDELEFSKNEKNDLQNVQGYVRLDKDIIIDYYYFSLLKDLDQLLNLAFNKNPAAFAELFCAEMQYMQVFRHSPSIFEERKDFYDQLMTHWEMKNFSHYDECKKAMDEAYSCYQLSPPNQANVQRNDFDSFKRSFSEFLNPGQGQKQNNFQEMDTSNLPGFDNL